MNSPGYGPVVARLRVYPFKSLDGADVGAASFVARGALRWDRTFAFVDAGGAFVNGKREPRLHRLRVAYDDGPAAAVLTSELTAERCAFAFDAPGDALTAFASRHVGRDVGLRRNDDGGFPDDARAPGPTIVSTATLAAVAGWFDGLTVEDVRLRLRANVEIDGVPAFWEDRLFGAAGEPVPFRIGAIALGGTNPCARCIVPTRDARTGEGLPAFPKHVAEQRAATLPAWSDRARFDHFYRLCVNTQAPDANGGTIRVGDPVTLA